MTSISSIETSFYPGLIEGFSPKSMQPVEAVGVENAGQNAGNSSRSYYEGDNFDDVDLSNYYSNIRPEDLLSQAGRNVTQSAEALDNAMVSAIQNGYGVNEACNIKMAEMAYKANAYMFKVASDVSTFLLEI